MLAIQHFIVKYINNSSEKFGLETLRRKQVAKWGLGYIKMYVKQTDQAPVEVWRMAWQ